MRLNLPIAYVAAGAGVSSAFHLIAGHWPGSDETPYFWPLGVVLFSTLVFVWGVKSASVDWTVVPLTLLGVGIGVVVDAAYVSSVKGIDPNLWPIAIAVWWGLSLVPMAFAFFLAKAVRRKFVAEGLRSGR
jgi:hypothetical protein